MLRSSSGERSNEYSRITCINASREILSRFVILHSINGIVYSCRIVDFLTLMAAMTLLLAHLDSYLWGAENLLTHQNYSDRAMIEQVQETMEEVDGLNSDPLSAQSAALLRRLLIIEAETPIGHQDGARRVSLVNTGTQTSPPLDNNAVLMVYIPYFGTIKIACEGINKEVTKSPTAVTHRIASSQGMDRLSTLGEDSLQGTQMQHSEFAMPTEITDAAQSNTPVDAGGQVEALSAMSVPCAKTLTQLGTASNSATAANEVDSLQTDLLNPVWQCSEYPGLAAGGED